MTNQDFDRNRRESRTDYGTSSFSPLVIGAAAVIIALVAFLYFADNTGTQQAEFNTNPPATTTTPAPLPDRSPGMAPSNPPATTPAPAPTTPSTPPAQ